MSRIEVKGVLSLDGSGWDRSIDHAQQKTRAFADEGLGQIKAMVGETFAVAAIEEFIRHEVEAISKIKELSETSGLSTDMVQELGRAAGRVGLQFEDVARALSKFGAARKAAGEHEGKELEELQKYGVTLQDVRNGALSNLDVVLKMRDAMEELSKTAEGRQELREFFGKGGDKLAAVFDQLSTMKPIQLITPEQIESIDKAVKDLKDLKLIVEALAAGTVSSGSKVVSDVLNGNITKDTLKNYLKATLLIPDNVYDFILGGGKKGAESQPGAPGSASGTPESPKTIFNFKDNKALWEELHRAEQENRQAGLTHAQKILELEKERLEIIERMKGEKNDALLKDEIKLVQIDTKLKEANAQHVNLGLKSSDSLTKTGNFLGSSANSIVTIGERQVHLLQQIAHNTNPNTKGLMAAGNAAGTSSAPGF